MSALLTCPSCRATLPPRATAGLCPKCVFAAMLGDAPDESAPARLGEYDLLEPLGHGGMGTVWRARQRSAKRDVALKTVVARGADAERRFRAEIEAAARLDHANIVPVYEVGEADGQLWFTMRLLAGGTLAGRTLAGRTLAGRTLDAREAAALVAKLARAIAYAHERGVLHRDLKPANVLLDDTGEPFIADFGLARMLDADASLSVSGAVVGTPQYMAPEQASGGTATTATDVHGLGAILYELLAGRAPFEGKSTVEVLRRVCDEEPQRWSSGFSLPGAMQPKGWTPAAPRDLEIITLKCLAKSPARRYATAAVLADDLDRWLRGEPIEARPATRIERLRAWARRHRALAASLAVAFVAMGVFIFLQWRHGHALGTERDTARGERDAAQSARTRAERSEATLAENLHAADMQLAWQAFAMRDLGEARRVLARVRSTALKAVRPAAILAADSSRSEGAADRKDSEAASGTDAAPYGLQPRATFEHRLLATLCEGGQEKTFSNLGPSPSALVWMEKPARLRVVGGGWMLDLDPETGVTTPVSRGFHITFDERSARPGAAKLFPIEPWPAGFGAEPPAWLQNVNPGPPGDPVTVAAPADGRFLATSDRNRWSRVWDTTTGEFVGAAPATHGTVSMDAAGRWLAVGSRRHTDVDRGSALLDLDTRRDAWLLPEAGGAAAISRDGTRLFTGTFQNKVRAWEVTTRRELRAWSVPQWTSALAISNDGKRAAYALAFDRTIVALDVESGAVLREMRGHGGRVHALAFSPDGSQLASAAADQTARLWTVARESSRGEDADAARGLADYELRGHAADVTGVAWSPDGARVATASPDGSVRIWNRDGPRGVAQVAIPSPEMYRPLLFIQPEKRLVAVARWEAPVEIANFRTGERTTLPGTNGGAEGWDGDALVICTATHDALEWRETTGAIRRRVALEKPSGRPLTRRLSADARVLAAVGADRRLRVWETRGGALTRELGALAGSTVNLALTRDGRIVVAAAYDGLTSAFDTTTGATLWTTPRAGTPRFADISPDGTLVALANSAPNEIHMHDTRTGELRARLTGHTEHVWAAVFSPDSRTLASTGHDQTARLWHVATARQLAVLATEKATGHLAFSPDGQWLLTGTAGGKVIAWRAR